MSNGLHANTSAMNTNGKETVASADEFSAELASLRSNVENLLGMWHGISANNFSNSYEEQASNLQAFQQLLNELGESISKGAEILNRTEEDNAAAGQHLFRNM